MWTICWLYCRYGASAHRRALGRLGDQRAVAPLIVGLGDEDADVCVNITNVLVMSLRATSTEVAREILDAWFSETVKEEEKPTIAHLEEIEAWHR
jgi:HEAT repeat protein